MIVQEPTADRGLQPAATDEPKLEHRMEGVVSLDPEPEGVSDQV